jgi:MoaA/NifB/PqqE/SkfB family radical SAM enzyme
MNTLLQEGNDSAVYSPEFTQLVVTKKCNLSCSYCNEHDHRAKEVPMQDLKERISRLVELDARSVSLIGGEPLLHPGIMEVIRYSCAGFKRVMMTTNGRLLSEDRVEELNDSGLHDLEVSIDGVHAGPGVQKVLDRVRDKLDILERLAKFQVNINIAYGAMGFEEVAGLVKYAKDHFFSTTLGPIHDDRGQLAIQNGSFEEYEALLAMRKAPEWGKEPVERNLMKNGVDPFNCRGGSRYLYVSDDGQVLWCSQTRRLFHKPLKVYSKHDLEEQYHTEKPCTARCTLGCVRAFSR